MNALKNQDNHDSSSTSAQMQRPRMPSFGGSQDETGLSTPGASKFRHSEMQLIYPFFVHFFRLALLVEAVDED